MYNLILLGLDYCIGFTLLVKTIFVKIRTYCVTYLKYVNISNLRGILVTSAGPT